MAAGVPDELYWQLTPPELAALTSAIANREGRRDLLFGLVASEIYNSNPYRKGKARKPSDYFRKPSKGPSAEFMKRYAERPLMRLVG